MGFDPTALITSIMNGYITETASLEEMLYVKGKVAIVTGGASGLGFCIAQRLLQGGASVVLASSSTEKGKTALELLKRAGYEKVSYIQTDVRREDEVKGMVEFAVKTYGSLDILVTSSGVWGFAHVYDMPEEEFRRVVDVNLVGSFLCAKHASKYMIEHDIKGKIVLISSNSAFLSQPVFGGYAHYVASKGGVVAMTQELAKELKRFGICVNTVAPGGMMTPGNFYNGPCQKLPPEKLKEIGEEMTVNQMDEIPSADSVAIVAYGMCTRMSDGMNGECIVADSGMMRNIVKHQPTIREYPAKKEA